jgi:sterol desaturase/sphingolipid hydroxylase (fatty acid hydroxylase superfamily)
MHPVDIWLNFVVVSAMLGVNAGVFGFLFSDPPQIFAVNGINLVVFATLVLGYHLRHSHVWVMYPRVIARHLSSPAMHLIHHSKDPKHWDKNLARIFNFWDRLAGTLYLPTEEETLAFGLGGDEHLKFRSLSALYGRPIENIIARWRPAQRKGAAVARGPSIPKV